LTDREQLIYTKRMNKVISIAIVVIVIAFGIYYGVSRNSDKQAGTVPDNQTTQPERALVASGHPEWQPIMFKSGEEIQGAGPALEKMIFDKLGVKTEFPYKGAWDEVQAKAKSGEVDSLVAAYKTDERLTYMDYSEPYTTDPVALFVKAGNNLKFEKPEDLIGKKGIGTVGDSYGQTFDNFIKAKLTVQTVKTSQEAFDLLTSGKADYFVYSLYAGVNEIKLKNLQGKVESLPHFVAEENFFITFSKKSPFTKYLPQVNELIKQYKADGTIDRLIAQYKNQKQ